MPQEDRKPREVTEDMLEESLRCSFRCGIDRRNRPSLSTRRTNCCQNASVPGLRRRPNPTYKVKENRDEGSVVQRRTKLRRNEMRASKLPALLTIPNVELNITDHRRPSEKINHLTQSSIERRMKPPNFRAVTPSYELCSN